MTTWFPLLCSSLVHICCQTKYVSPPPPSPPVADEVACRPHRVDINRDKSVSAKEMQRWIMEKTEEHFQQAVKENKLSFRAVDPDGDGRRLYPQITPFPSQEVLDNLKDRWFQADGPPADQLLNEEEFLSFLHPEHSRGMLKFMVKEIVRDLGEYMDPMNEYNALNEAKQMIAVADENQNRNLELEEILKYSEYFTGSKLMDYARNVHEEF
nr:PREDICTED: 45 kDa calcium-binding protein [Lepisosteus oculatus]